MVSALKVEPISNTPVVSRLMRVGSLASFGLFGSKSGTDTIERISPVRTSVITPAAAIALNFSRAATSSSRTACCTRRSTASCTGSCNRSVANPAACSAARPDAVEPLLHAGDALVVDIHQADQVRDLGAIRIDALVLVEKADPRNAELVDVLLLLRRDLAPQPGEAALAVAEPLAHLLGVEVRHDGGQQLHRLVDVDQPLRLAEQRGHPYVGREDLAAPVENVGPRGGDRVARVAAPRRMAVRASPRRRSAGPQ